MFGFYLCLILNQTVDGAILELNHSNEIRIQPNPDTSDPLEFMQGRNGIPTTIFTVETKQRISILPSYALLFDLNPLNNGQPEYEFSCSDDYNSSQWSGIGKIGNVLNINPNSKTSLKLI